MSTSQLNDRVAVLIALVAVAAGAAGQRAVIDAVILWIALLGAWALWRATRDRKHTNGGDDGRSDADEGRH